MLEVIVRGGLDDEIARIAILLMPDGTEYEIRGNRIESDAGFRSRVRRYAEAHGASSVIFGGL